MKVTLSAYIPTEAQISAGCPQMTPEMHCAVGARYSRNDEGLESILTLIDKKSPDKSIDSIFKMVDYGHASIGDMAPVAMFIDGISIWLTYYIWSICPTASGQETSTRYVKFDANGIISPFLAGIAPHNRDEWLEFISNSIKHYQDATAFWETIADAHPELVRIPKDLQDKAAIDGNEGHKARLNVTRLKRNFVFDRARYFIPVAAKTNVMLTMRVRDWVELVSTLASHYVLEAVVLAKKLETQLALVIPRLMKHCVAKNDKINGHGDDLDEDASFSWPTVGQENNIEVIVHSDENLDDKKILDSITEAFKYHTNRYARIGRAADSVFVNFSIPNISMAELRDLNRHRTGFKFSPAMPLGFYCAGDQLPNNEYGEFVLRSLFGINSLMKHRIFVRNKHESHPYWGLLGTQYYYKHGTTLSKLAYEIALRTGPGSHFKYNEHMREVHDKLILKIPTLAGKILVGSAEPE